MPPLKMVPLFLVMKSLLATIFLCSTLLGNICIVPVASAAPNRSTNPDELMSKVTEVSCQIPFSQRTALGAKARKVSCPGGLCLTEKETPDSAIIALQRFELPGMGVGVATVAAYSLLTTHYSLLSPEHPPLVRSSMIVVLRE